MVDRSSLTQTAWSRLRQFQDRAQAVAECALARRADLATLGSTMTLLRQVGDQSGTMRMIRDQPPIAEIDQAAARVRPLFLEKDEVHHSKVTMALGLLAQGAPADTRELVKRLKQAWVDLPKGMRYSIAVATAGPPDTGLARTDRQIADDYLYGELIHDDPVRRARNSHLPEGEKYMAALLWAKDAILLTRATQQLIIDLEDAGQLRG